MRAAKFLVRALAVVVVALTLFATLFVCHTQNVSGGFSAVCEVGDEAKAWVAENFFQFDTVDALMDGMLGFALSNFTYDNDGYPLIQTADFDRFIFDDSFHGVCFEFSVFAKTVALLWAEEKGVDMKAYICNVWYLNKQNKRVGHSYNYFEYDQKTVYLDLTADLSSFNADMPELVYGAVYIDMPKQDYNRKLFKSDNTTYI